MNTDSHYEKRRPQCCEDSAYNRDYHILQQNHTTAYTNNINDAMTKLSSFKTSKYGVTGDSIHNNIQLNDQIIKANLFPQPFQNQDSNYCKNNTESLQIYPQPPILSTDWKEQLFKKSINTNLTNRETVPKKDNSCLPIRNSNRKLSMSHYNPGICIYRPPSKNDYPRNHLLQDEGERSIKDLDVESSDAKMSIRTMREENECKNISSKNNNNHKAGKSLKKSSKVTDSSYNKFYNNYNLKLKGSSPHNPNEKKTKNSTQQNNNPLPPGGSILTMAKNMVKKYQPPVTPDRPLTDFYSFFKNTGSNMFVSLSNQDLFDDSHSTPNYDEHQYDEITQSDVKEDEDEKTRIIGKTSSSKKFSTHVEKIHMVSENTPASNNKKSRIYVNTNLPIKRVYNAGSASNFLKERFHNRSLKSSESGLGYDQTVHKVMKNLYDSWLEQSQCDVAIVTDDGEIMSHQALLSSFSCALARQFKANKPLHDNDYNSDAPQQIAVIDMSKFSKETIADILHFLYTTDIRLTDGNITKILMVAKKLELEVVTKKCEDYLMETGLENDLLLHYFIANNCDLRKIKVDLQSKVAKTFDTISVKNNLTKLSRSLLVGLLDHKDLVSKEENKLLAVSKWIEHNKAERMKSVAELMTFVKFEKIPIDSLTHLVENLEWMFTSSCMRNKLLEAYRFHTTKDIGEIVIETSNEETEVCRIQKTKQEHPDDNNNAYISFNMSSGVIKPQTTLEKKASNDQKIFKTNRSISAMEVIEKETSIACRGYKDFPQKNNKFELENMLRKERLNQDNEHEKELAKIIEKNATKKQAISISNSERKNFISNKSFFTEKLNDRKVENEVEKRSSIQHKYPKVKSSPTQLNEMEYRYIPSSTPPQQTHTDYNFSNCQNHQQERHHQHHHQNSHYNDHSNHHDYNNSRNLSKTRKVHKSKRQNHIGTSMTPAMDACKRKESSATSTVKSWQGASQGVVSIFESRFKPPPIKQYQLQNNLASVKYIEMDQEL